MTSARRIIRLDEAGSTNNEMASRLSSLGHGDTIACRTQTAGRGQRGNTWEAEPGMNLTFSLLLRPRVIRPAEAFRLSMLVSVAIVRTLSQAMHGREVLIKWPNDIYVDDLKLCGILIENGFTGGAIAHSIIGIGINVNQTVFLSDAPNPVSMAMLTGETYELQPLLARVVDAIVELVDSYEADPDAVALSEEYHSLLWRRTGVHEWIDNTDGRRFSASILSVGDDGILTLGTQPPRGFAFKEVTAVL